VLVGDTGDGIDIALPQIKSKALLTIDSYADILSADERAQVLANRIGLGSFVRRLRGVDEHDGQRV